MAVTLGKAVRLAAAGVLVLLLLFGGWVIQQIDKEIGRQNAAEPVHVFQRRCGCRAPWPASQLPASPLPISCSC
ncbi:MAG TPA: hypothetical protein VNI56_01985 [Xanthomonadaceae bacterium]|nr:hypothetical protein [Xanthomonadaceae bacterium]